MTTTNQSLTTTNKSLANNIAYELSAMTDGRINMTDADNKYSGTYVVEVALGIFVSIFYDESAVRFNANITGIHNDYFDVTGKDYVEVATQLVALL
jgi:hypothetical protein